MKYELMVILDPQKTDKEIDALSEEIKKHFSDHGLAFLEEDVWGQRDLTHKIKGRMQGYYIVMNFEGEPAGLPIIHKELKLVVGLLRYMLLKMPEDYSLMRYDKPAPKKAAAKLSAHAEELQKKVTKSSEKAERTEKKVAKVEEVIEIPEPEEKPEERVEAPVEEKKEETPAEAPAAPVAEEKSDDAKLDEKLQAIIDDADIDL